MHCSLCRFVASVISNNLNFSVRHSVMLFSAQRLFFVAWKHYYHSQCPHTHTHTHTTRHREPPHDSSDGKWKCGVRVLCESEYTLCRERPQECNTLNIVNIFFPLRSYGLTVLTQSTYSQGYIKPNTYCILCYNVMDMTTVMFWASCIYSHYKKNEKIWQKQIRNAKNWCNRKKRLNIFLRLHSPWNRVIEKQLNSNSLTFLEINFFLGDLVFFKAMR